MRTLAAAALLVPLAACASGWSGGVKTHGSLREVLREGRSEGRVELEQAIGPRSVGIGALEGLRGEIAVIGGTPWIGRVEDGRVTSEAGLRPGDRAALLALAEVKAWTAVELLSEVSGEDLAARLASVAAETGVGRRSVWPFQIRGELLDVEAHVLNGQCPQAGPVDPGNEPVRRSFASIPGTLVGFYAPGEGGKLVHHGQALHMHLVVEEPNAFVGHVDSVRLAPGAVLLLPSQ